MTQESLWSSSIPTRRLLAVFLIMLARLSFPGLAVAGEGVGFLGNRELTVTLTGSSPTAIQVKVINGSSHSQNVHLDAVGLTNEDDTQIPLGVLPDDLPLMAADVVSGTVTPFDLVFTYVEGLSGSYTGQLVTYGDDGSVDRLDLTLVVEEEQEQSIIPTAALLQPDFVETVTLVAVNHCPSPLAQFGLQCVTLPTLSVNEALSRTKSVVGSLSGDNGELGQVVQNGTNLQVEGITQAGEYEGKADLLPDDDDTDEGRGEVTIKLKVRDAFWWPLLVLIVGLVLSTFLDRYIKVGRPRKHLQINLERLKEQALCLQMEAKQALPSDWPFENDVFRVYDKKPESGRRVESGLLAKATTEVVNAFETAGSDEERKKWGPDGTEFKRVQEYVDALPGLYQLSRTAFNYYRSLRERVLNHYPNIDLGNVPVLGQVADAARPGLIMGASQLNERQEQLKTASSFVTDFSDLYQRLISLTNLAGQPTHRKMAQDLLDRLVSGAIVSADWLVEIDAAAKRLELDIQAAQVRGYREGPVLLGSRGAEAAIPAEHWRLLVPWPVLPLPDARKLFGLLRPVEKVSERTSRDLQKELWRLDLTFNLLSGFIVVVTGLSALYLGNASFGSLADYVGLLLWGTVVDEGFKIARQLVPGLARRL